MKGNAQIAAAPENADELIGKKFVFKSSPGMHPSLIKAQITTKVCFNSDSLSLKADPPRLMPADKVELNDIREIRRCIKLSPQLVIFALIAALYALFSGNYWFLAFSPVLVLRGINYVVTLIRKSGASVSIYSSSKKSADLLKKNIERLLPTEQQRGKCL